MPSLPELKLSYYTLMIKYYAHYNNYLEITRCYRAIYEMDSVQADAEKWGNVSAGLLIVLAGKGRVRLGPAYEAGCAQADAGKWGNVNGAFSVLLLVQRAGVGALPS